MTNDRPIEKYAFIVTYHAKDIYKRLPAYVQHSVSVEDLEQEGWIAFIRACRNFEPSHNVKFTTFLTLNLILTYSTYIARVCAKKRLPLLHALSLDQIRSIGHGNRFNHRFPAYADPCFRQIEFRASLESSKKHVSKSAQEFISFLLSEEFDGASRQELCKELKVGNWKLTKIAGEILNAVNSKPLLNGWKLTK